MTCDNCGHPIEDGDERTGVEWGSWSEPSSTFSACRFCCPSARELEGRRDAEWDRRLDALREGCDL